MRSPLQVLFGLLDELVKGGPGSGNFGHGGGEGGPGNPGGSTSGGGGGATRTSDKSGPSKFRGAPTTAANAKAWIRSRQTDYDSDPEFKTAVDAATLLTQGSTVFIHAASVAAAGGTPKGEMGKFMKEPLSRAANPMAIYKNYFKGQNVEKADYVTLREAGKILNKAVDSADPIAASIFRGMHVSEVEYKGSKTFPNPALTRIEKLVVGDRMDMRGVTSFTGDLTIATQFSNGTARGQAGRSRGGSRSSWIRAVTIEVRPGARALPVSALSPWRQKEFLTRGKFRVVRIDRIPRYVDYRDSMDYHIVLEQQK